MMHQTEILAFPSIRELGAGVVVEAMASSMACCVVDYGGPATLIDSERGVKISLGTFEELVERFESQLETLVTNPERVTQLGQAAHEHAITYYTWEAKAKKTLEIYQWLRAAQKPNFWTTPSTEWKPSIC